MRVHITVPGEPVGKERPRYSAKSGTIYTPSTTLRYEKLVAMIYRASCGNMKFPADRPLDMRIQAFLSVPKSDTGPVRLRKLGG